MRIKTAWILASCLLVLLLSWSSIAAETSIYPRDGSELTVGSRVLVNVTGTRPIQKIVVRNDDGWSETYFSSSFELTPTRVGNKYYIQVFTSQYCVQCSDDYIYYVVGKSEKIQKEILCKDYLLDVGVSMTQIFGECSFARYEFHGTLQLGILEFGIWGLLVNNDPGFGLGASLAAESSDGWFLGASTLGTPSRLGEGMDHWDASLTLGKQSPYSESASFAPYLRAGYIFHNSTNAGLWEIAYGELALRLECCFRGFRADIEFAISANSVLKHVINFDCYEFSGFGARFSIGFRFVEP